MLLVLLLCVQITTMYLDTSIVLLEFSYIIHGLNLCAIKLTNKL